LFDVPRGVDRYDEAQLQGRLWTPTLLRGEANLWAWFDASDLSTVTLDGSGNVSDWADKSGNARHTTQATSGIRPIWANNVFGHRPGIKGGTGATLRRLTSTGTPSLAQPLTVYVVTKVNGTLDSFACAFNGLQTGSNAAHVALKRSDVSNNPAIWGGTALKTIGSTLSVGSRYILGAVFNGASTVGFTNGTDTSASSAGTLGVVSGFNLCGADPANMASDAYFAEFVVVSKSMSAIERRRMEAYLAWKWGLVDIIPADNPYKNRPPLIGD
jgi:hypothetical protein